MNWIGAFFLLLGYLNRCKDWSAFPFLIGNVLFAIYAVGIQEWAFLSIGIIFSITNVFDVYRCFFKKLDKTTVTE
tara:strand:+ start:42899 stop:43123 length:225 start_codon:yes stop_codon:yes gene_type:complete